MATGEKEEILMKTSSISRIGMVFIIYLFCLLITFFILSEPIDMIWDSFSDADFAEGEDEKDSLILNIRTVMKMFWALFMTLPLVWVVSKVFSREPATYYRRYRR